MVKCWFMDDIEGDQRQKHLKDENSYLTLDQLKQLTGVEYINVPDIDPILIEKIKKDREYNYEDEITCSKECLDEDKLKIFYTEHLHTDEEIRLIVDGTGYFDVRDVNDNWIRIEVIKGDLIVLPSGMYHRFTMDLNNYVKARRFFKGEPVWKQHNRPADDMECRKQYLFKTLKGF